MMVNKRNLLQVTLRWEDEMGKDHVEIVMATDALEIFYRQYQTERRIGTPKEVETIKRHEIHWTQVIPPILDPAPIPTAVKNLNVREGYHG